MTPDNQFTMTLRLFDYIRTLERALTKQTERACRFNADAESACQCPAHETYREAAKRR